MISQGVNEDKWRSSLTCASQNKVTFLLLMKYFRPRLFLMVEQPTSSWLFKQRCWKEITKRWGLTRYLCHQGFYGHDLLKPTHLVSNFSSLTAIETRATKKRKNQHKKEVKRRNRRLRALGLPVKCYYKKLAGGGFQGGPDLASSAIYPSAFLLAVYRCWLDRESIWVWSVATCELELLYAVVSCAETQWLPHWISFPCPRLKNKSQWIAVWFDFILVAHHVCEQALWNPLTMELRYSFHKNHPDLRNSAL